MNRSRRRSLHRLPGSAALALALLGCSSLRSEDDLLDLEYQYHRVGNRKATVEELKEMEQREENHLVDLQAEIDVLQHQERELITERDSRDATLPLLAKQLETLQRDVAARKAELEGALAVRGTLEHEHDLVTSEIARLRAQITELRSVLERSESELAPEQARLSALLERVGKELDQAQGFAPVGPEPPPGYRRD
jgi:chromosome segregation ATPase